MQSISKIVRKSYKNVSILLMLVQSFIIQGDDSKSNIFKKSYDTFILHNWSIEWFFLWSLAAKRCDI